MTDKPEICYSVRIQEYTYEISAADPDDRWDNGQYGLDVYLINLYKSHESNTGFDIQWLTTHDDIYGYDDIAIGETAYVVLVKYQTGDTFGTSETWCIPAIKSTREEAEKVIGECEGDNNSSRTFRPWDGYFEHLQYAEVVPILVEP